MDPTRESPALAGQGEKDLTSLLRRFGVRALGLALVAGLLGLTTLAILLSLAGFGLLFARP
ncbi:hypothetical protein [Amycolatopsis samaneae]|uniref:Uncharacterized protein n=1 Tax=Amycolatopsis samaneae TaxID=664691 RepID=A0ABW5GLE6_9PSEU